MVLALQFLNRGLDVANAVERVVSRRVDVGRAFERPILFSCTVDLGLCNLVDIVELLQERELCFLGIPLGKLLLQVVDPLVSNLQVLRKVSCFELIHPRPDVVMALAQEPGKSILLNDEGPCRM